MSEQPPTPLPRRPNEGDAGKGQPSPEQMLKALRKSGYLFEHEVAIDMENMGFHVERSHAYRDPEEGKSRELDVRAYKSVLRNRTYNFHLGVDVFMECKDNETPFVFMQTKKNDHDVGLPEARECYFPYSLRSGSTPFRLVQHGLHGEHYYYSETKKSVQFAKIVRENSGFKALHDNVYDALLLPQVKAYLAWMSKFNFHQRSMYQAEYARLGFNVIVLRDHLYTLDLDDPNALPIPTGRVSFVRQIEMKDISGKYLVDFVTQSYLDTYIQSEVMEFVGAVVRAFENNPMGFRANGGAETPPDLNWVDLDPRWSAGRLAIDS